MNNLEIREIVIHICWIAFIVILWIIYKHKENKQ